MRVPLPKDFDEITLSESQIEELIYEERVRIYYEVKAEQKKNISQNEKMEAKRLFSADELAAFVLKENPSFILDEFSKPVFDLLCLYFSRDKRFKECGEGFSLYKGIAISGNPGTGKTELMSLFQKNKRQCYLVCDMNDVQERCDYQATNNENKDFYKTFTSQVPGWSGKEFFYQDAVTWCIDDCGKEDILFSYGNKSYVFSKIIEYRSSPKQRQLLQYYPLHITTMLNAENFGNKYGDFIRSRMREQFNWISLKGNDRRK